MVSWTSLFLRSICVVTCVGGLLRAPVCGFESAGNRFSYWQSRDAAAASALDEVDFPSSVFVDDDHLDDDAFSPEMIRRLMRPNFDLGVEWQAETDGLGMITYDAGMTLPTYPIFGPPPPLLNVGFRWTDLDAPLTLGLPSELYETEFGVAWMRRVNDRWMTRVMAGASYATDGHNQSRDAWQFRGGAFALFQQNPRWTWAFGAIALGRNDLPVLPAVGLIYQPNPALRFDLMMPRPRIAMLLRDNGPRQQWVYLGAGLRGTTWGIERSDGADDQLTYGDVRVTLGWESTPAPIPGMPFTPGRKLGVEFGYAFSRDFEFENAAAKIRLDASLLLRGYVTF